MFRQMRGRSAPAVVLALVAIVSAGAANAKVKQDDAKETRALEASDLSALSWRSVGPANMGGRVAAIALSPSEPKTFFIGYATGGLWKTTNNGTTFTPVFDSYETSSIGSVAVADAPSDWDGWKDDDETSMQDRAQKGRGMIVWVGTGEGNNRNSSSWGHGVYRSTDGGQTFTNVGLENTHEIPALAVDPRDPDVCYVAALGHLWGTNKERGVYKTDDGGETWDQVLEIDDETGACDVVIDPDDPDTVYAAMYSRIRKPWKYESGEEGGIYKSTDAGRTWKKLTSGLPKTTGRIGLAIAPSDTDRIYASVESTEGGKVGDPFDNRSRSGGLFRSDDAGKSWERVSDFNPRAFYFSRVSVDPTDADRVYLLGWEVYVSEDGGHTVRAGVANVPHVDFHAMAIDPDDPERLLVGNDGGLYVSYDRGKTWDFHNHMAVGQFYNVAVDDSDPYRVGGGLQDNGSWMGVTENLAEDRGEGMGRAGAISNQEWTMVNFGDGFHFAFDPTDPDIVYAESQGGYINRIHLNTGEIRTLRPVAREGQERYRFNWNAPFFISRHDPTVLYLGGNCVFRLTDRGDAWEQISDDLSRRDVEKIMTEGSDAETYGTIVSLAESPVEQGVLWAGTDDGLVHLSFNGGRDWKDVTPRAVDGRYVSCIEASSHDDDTAYVAVDGHRTDSFEPVLLMTTDRGRSWESIVGDLPDDEPVEVVREDPTNANVLYVGTERGAYVTIDRGDRWVKLGDGLPTVAVDDLALQRREMDLVAGTHGRSVWVVDDLSPLGQMNSDSLARDLHVFDPLPAQPRYRLLYGGLWSDRMFLATNPPSGGAISYWLRERGDGEATIEISDARGHVVRTLKGSADAGLNRVMWDLHAEPNQRLGSPDGLPEFVAAGLYTVKVTCAGTTEGTTLEVLPAPGAESDE
jgi:photosystem II stability/assembly factor-like uncharacterized protein